MPRAKVHKTNIIARQNLEKNTYHGNGVLYIPLSHTPATLEKASKQMLQLEPNI